jgi:hypothetical protein
LSSRRSCRRASRTLAGGLLAGAFLCCLALPARAAEPLVLTKGVIRQDTTWSGEVHLVGQNVVKKGATLTILPGTRVVFPWIDEDGDGVGDGELNVEGRIVARGEKGKLITFTSGKPEPAMKDWTFVVISTSRDSVVEYCLVEYAFSGFQVHYSTAAIRNCVFRGNFEGVRFSTTEVLIENNDFTGNYYAIRYEANGSRATIRRNRIQGNRYGFFPVQRSTSTVRIAENNVTDSSEFQVYFGDNQRADLDYQGNWWGTADPAKIAAGFYDRTRDPLLGRVLWDPPLAAPVEPCGVQ